MSSSSTTVGESSSRGDGDGVDAEDTQSSPSPKKVRSQPPDVKVAVGSADGMQEFECYRIVLSFASKYLDTMLSARMKEDETSRIEFPDKDPKEWKMFHTFIDPATSRSAKLSDDNVFLLLPWFHEFQMSTFVKECDTYLAEIYVEQKIVKSRIFWEGKLSYDL